MPNKNNTIQTKRYYPRLSSILSIEDIPDTFGFVKDGIDKLFKKIHYKDLQYNKSPRGDAAFYSLSIISKKRLAIEVPGTGIFLVLNPDVEDNNISAFPITVEYEWKVLAYLRSFNLQQFSFAPQDFFQLALRVFNLSEEQAIANFINTFVEPINVATTALQQFVKDVNKAHNLNIPAPTVATKISDIVTQIYTKSGEYATLIAFTTYIVQNDLQETKNKLNKFFRSLIPQDIEEYIKDILIPKAKASLTLSAGMEFPRKMLIPVYDKDGKHPTNDQLTGEPFSEIAADAKGDPKVMLTFGEALFHASTEEGFGYTMDLVLNTTYPAMIGNTGLIIDIQNIKIDLSKKENILEADLDNRSPDFIGAYIEEAAIILPPKWFKNQDKNTILAIIARNMLVGTGGVSGSLALEAIGAGVDSILWVNIGKADGFKIGFESFDIEFKQGRVLESNIKGALQIPRLKDANNNIASIEISGHLDDDGGFNITASEQDGFAPITLPNVLKLHIQSLEVGRESKDEPFYIGTACDIEFTNQVITKIIGDQRISVERLRIYSDGSFEIEGGAISVPTNFTLRLGPVEVSITGINYGSTQEEHNGVMRKYNYFGFDGGISAGNIGVEARGEGVKYFFTVDGGDDFHSYIKIATIEVDLTIPGNASASSATAIIKGWLSINETEYAGGVSLKLPKLKMAGGADMRMQPKPPAFLIDAHLDIPTPIPLAATGLGITGFRGIAGFKYIAEKEAVGLTQEDKWYDYYTYPPRGIHVSKFNGPDKSKNAENAFSLGAGVTIATLGSGNIISLRVMAFLSIPSMFMIDGRGSIISKEWGLDDSGEPPFYAFLILSKDGIEIGAGLDFKLPQDGKNKGKIIDLNAYLEAGYFWNNPGGWYLNLGTRKDRITAKILTLVEMESFLMISASGIEAGARVSFEFNKKFGPARVKAWLIAEVGGFISFERPQIGGYMSVDGGAEVRVMGFEVGVSLKVVFAVEAAKPFLIYAEVRVCGRIKILFAKIKVCATVKIKWEKDRHLDKSPIPPIPRDNIDTLNGAVKGVHMLTGESFDLIYFNSGKGTLVSPNQNDPKFNTVKTAIIPLDTYIDIKLDKSVMQDKGNPVNIGSYTNPPENYEDLIPPKKVNRQVLHRYQIVDIKIMAAQDGAKDWVEYHPYEAVVDSERTDLNEILKLPIGHWQKANKEYNAIRLLADSPFSYVEQGEPGWFVPEQLGLTPSTLFCEGKQRAAKCANWLHTPLNKIYRTAKRFPFYHAHQDLAFNVLQGRSSNVKGIVINSNAKVVNTPNAFGYQQSLEFANTSALEFKLPKASLQVTLKLSSTAQKVNVIYYKTFIPENGYLVEYEEIETVTYTREQLANSEGITYATDVANLVSKIKIIPVLGAAQQEIDVIYEQIEQLFIDTYEQYGSGIPEEAYIPLPNDVVTYFHLLGQLKSIQQQTCIAKESVCDLYQRLKYELYECMASQPNVNIIDGEIKYDKSNTNQPFIPCFSELIKNIEAYEDTALRNSIKAAIEELKNLNQPSRSGGAHLLKQTHTVAEKILAKIYDFGNCGLEVRGCEPCTISEKLKVQYDTCFNLGNNATLNQLEDATACLDEIADIVNCADIKPTFSLAFPQGKCCEPPKPTFTLAFPKGKCCELAKPIVEITFPQGNCIVLPKPTFSLAFPQGKCCALPKPTFALAFPKGKCCELPKPIVELTFPEGNCSTLAKPTFALAFPQGKCCALPKPTFALAFPQGKCCALPKPIVELTFPEGNCSTLAKPTFALAFPQGKCCALPKPLVGITFPEGNCITLAKPTFALAFPQGKCCALPKPIVKLTFQAGNCITLAKPTFAMAFPQGKCCALAKPILKLTFPEGNCSELAKPSLTLSFPEGNCIELVKPAFTWSFSQGKCCELAKPTLTLSFPEGNCSQLAKPALSLSFPEGNCYELLKPAFALTFSGGKCCEGVKPTFTWSFTNGKCCES